MMALNIAVPLTTVGDLMEGFGLLSPISPLSVDCRGVSATGTHGKQQLVSPVGSESSGVSSLDSDEIKKPSSSSTTPTKEVEGPQTTSSPIRSNSEEADTTLTKNVTPTPSTRSSLSMSDSSFCSSDETGSTESCIVEPKPVPKAKEVKVTLGGRNVLDLMDNLTKPNHFCLQFAQLPENDNIHFFLDNRSQYHRLGANGHIQEYTMVKCKCCDFRYPVNDVTPSTASSIQSNLTAAAPSQQQPIPQQFPWNGITNNLNSIVNSRDKMSISVAANAFNKSFGGVNNNTTNNNGNSNGSQYLRNGSMTAGIFGRDSNRNNCGGNFLNNSTNSYNNQKSYQQNFGTSNNSKIYSPYGNNYQLQQQQQQQQQFYSKNQQMRFGSGTGNGNGTGQSNGSNAFNSVAVAAALANPNLLNFNNFNNTNNYNSKSNNNSSMFAYYKNMM
ncbi:putative uncharacterized protein DDB_G0286901 isoform X2 [Toxorhynchites rutilus septentrionalis]|uniref:putative uncharacterized protein DDB_G0286901 isoform X2 n=1 Tax=Toxorhynchites rutilus septentrionalis TaxID=329112 RepID=UPI002478448A|nr:putative uncharacterized protein DDB_G0286901 isoform X2 [Toxorhynchites rutilus septentrionalis]